ncbi:hypothetical protein A6302_04164 [Methylobrevis pamukkalensis]|uniref:Tetratricopeptide repeat protein n=1 Tax=Methylobrevis pamukkalensis TaxID=1439726 RepID=A0A1E3GYZ1_9HYPH|nr:hypothetical protein A6302_04164 [Methylobrevis pamukkalensis]
MEQPAAPFEEKAVKVEIQRIGTVNRLTFTYKTPVDAALFSRGGALWMVFDDAMPIDLGPLQAGLAGIARRIEPISVNGAQALRIEMADPLLASLDADGTYWVVTIGDMVARPTRPLPVMRSVRPDGRAALDIPYDGAGRAIEVVDPAAGDRIVVVTGKGDPRGLIKPQSFTDVEALSSAYGLAFVPRVDDLEVQVRQGSGVAVERPAGLNISLSFPSRDTGFDAGGDGQALATGGFDLAAAAVPPAEFWPTRKALQLDISAAQDIEGRAAAWRRLIALYMAEGLGPEAEAALDVLGSLRPEEAENVDFKLQMAGAKVLSHKPAEALSLLADEDLEASPEAAVWRTIAAEDNRNHAEARRSQPRGETVIGAFPKTLQNRFLLASARAAVGVNDFGAAVSAIRQIDRAGLDRNDALAVDILNARMADANARAVDALSLLNRVVLQGDGAEAAEATLRLVRIQHREGILTVPQAIDRLEGLAASWRGDEIELQALRLLAQLSVENGDWRRGFEAMRTANLVNADSDTTRLISNEMSAAFAALYLDGKAAEMEPLKALALYYDFKELTPIGHRGDEMVRKLADRLVDVDLLDQAAALLQHQVDHRLKGAARAQVAADLAMVQLLDRRPDRALAVLGRTRQAQLPASIERQRRLVEAKALADTGKTDLALEMVGSLSGIDADRLVADTLWSAARYQKAGEQFERLLAARWSDAVPLTDIEQVEVLKTAISYALAPDPIGLDRLRGKFAAKMATSPKAAIFDAVTGPIDVSGHEFRVIAANIAAIDTMRAFLADYRSQFVDRGPADGPEVMPAAPEPAPAPAPANVSDAPEAAAPGEAVGQG